jgi:integrase
LIYGTATGSMKARDVGPAHIRDILAQLYRAGAKTARNRLRAYLHAAFAFGLRSEYDESRESGRSFGLTSNPVAVTQPLDGVERAGTRYLNADELRLFYNTLDATPTTHRIMVAFLRFLIALGGQRPQQVLEVPWTDYDFESRTIRIIDRKGRSALPRVHLVPLTDRALELLEIARSVNPPDGDNPRTHPWTARGSEPISIQSLKNVIKRFRETEAGAGISHFTARDLRRTAKFVMTQAGVRRDLRNLIQNHGQTGVDTKHYANDPAAHLPEKRQAMIAYEAALDRVLTGKALTDNVVQISTGTSSGTAGKSGTDGDATPPAP